MKTFNINVYGVSEMRKEELSVNGGGPLGHFITGIFFTIEAFIEDIAQGSGSGEWMLEIPPHILFS